ncbi:MAG: hypothetical protein LH702_19960 [Phormidesmis sp. CAN_BIN44]|nr:hypothetical protein [Phormidesmis sp. CAN_BIN44]
MPEHNKPLNAFDCQAFEGFIFGRSRRTQRVDRGQVVNPAGSATFKKQLGITSG